MATSNVVIPANSLEFEKLCDLFEKLFKTKKNKKKYQNSGKKQEQYEILENFINHFKVCVASIQGQKNGTIFPVLRLLLPDCDRDRGPYNLKEKNLGVLLVKVLSLSKQSGTAKKLLNFKSVDSSQDSDFAGVAYFALKSYIHTKNSIVTIGIINEILDKIANAEVGKKGSILDDTFVYALKNLTAEQFKWFLRIILKDLKLGIGSNRILAAFHPDAPECFKNCGSLSKVCDELEDGDTRPLELGIKVFYAISPMLSERLDVTQLEQHISFDKTYIVENKFDGERFQVHMENGVFEYYSRKGHKYSDNYGKTYDSGSLTPLLKGCFNSEVTSFILDGEMMGWHKVNEHFSCKGMAFDVKKITSYSSYRPCFCAFDVLFYNGRHLIGSQEKGGISLKERLKILDSLFSNVTGVIQNSVRETVKNSKDILDKLNQAIENEEEGIVLKDVESYYIPSRRNAGWYKIKPEYTESTMTDLDLVIIGADEAANKKHGRARSFYVACVDKSTPGEPNSSTRWLCVGRVVTGLSHAERESLCTVLEKYWTPTRIMPAPPQLVFNKEKPDFWILPEHSTVLQVRATELIRSVSYGTEYTLRFPRVERIRNDKPVDDVITLDYFDGLTPVKDPVKKLSSKLVSSELMGTATQKIRGKRRAKEIQVAEQFRTTIADPVEVTSKALQGRKICILSDNELCSRSELLKIVKRHSGIAVSNVGPDTWCAVVGKINKRERAIIESQIYDVVSCVWLINLPSSESPCTITPLDMLAMKKTTRELLCREYDEFGDCYTTDINEETLKKIFARIDEREQNIYLTKQEMLNIDHELFGAINPYSFLRPCCIHVYNNNKFDAIKAKMFGATLCEVNSSSLTHIIISKSTNSDEIIELKKGKHALIVSEEWLDECYHKKISQQLPVVYIEVLGCGFQGRA
ncbi:unnamed protein product [Diatraea saccharalis]|uniref:DNA ligase 4 n=1 Tax=Diatraea saccharalis TaxID=40085 RepID=A0A9N9RCP8_9NEOP|nr:unnamed protein product [Diatraea saccharalis]